MKEILSKISWVFAFLNAIAIFYFSTLTFPVGPPGPQSYFSIIYHFFAFFSLTFFLLLALVKGEKRRAKYVLLVIIIASLYGIFDEIHQFFVPGRACTIFDMAIDIMGVLIVSIIYSLYLFKKG